MANKSQPTDVDLGVGRYSAWWNGAVEPFIQYHCPETGREWSGTSNTCPDCRAPLDETHWKWWSPDEPRPEPPEGWGYDG